MFSLQKSSHSHRGKIIQKWTFEAKSPLLSSAAAADINGDGRKEIIFGTKDGKVFCLDQDSRELWRFAMKRKLGANEEFFYDQERIDAIPSTPATGDVNNDGKLEVLFGTELGDVYCLDATGKLLWSYKAPGPVKGRIAVSDIDGDGKAEILFGTSEGSFIVLDALGKERHAFSVKEPIESEPTIVKGEMTQIIFGSEQGTLFSYNSLGAPLWKFKAKEGIRAAPVVGTLQGENIVIGDTSGKLHCLDMKGKELWHFTSEGAIYARAAIADVNHDGNAEVIFGSCDNRVYCLSHRGERLWSYETDFWIVTPPILVDLDGDGSLEVVVGSFDQNLYVLDGEGAYSLDYMPGLAGVAHQAGHYTELLTQDPGEHIGKRLWQIKTQGMIVGCEQMDDHSIIVNVKSGFVDEIAHSK